MEKKLSPTEKQDLKFLIEDFLEKKSTEISTLIAPPGDAEEFWDKLYPILFKGTFWMDEVGPEDMAGIDFEALILDCHGFLNPMWKQFKSALFDFIYRVMPDREVTEDLRRDVEKNASSVFYEYRDLLKQGTVIDSEQTYDITFTVSFDAGHAFFYKRRPNLLKNFMDILGAVPISYFVRCGHCGRCIIRTRSDKQFCPGCAAKKYQKDKWDSDPEGMKQREKLRYHSTRKRPDVGRQ
jgi:hypothetical protein